MEIKHVDDFYMFKKRPDIKVVKGKERYLNGILKCFGYEIKMPFYFYEVESKHEVVGTFFSNGKEYPVVFWDGKEFYLAFDITKNIENILYQRYLKVSSFSKFSQKFGSMFFSKIPQNIGVPLISMFLKLQNQFSSKFEFPDFPTDDCVDKLREIFLYLLVKSEGEIKHDYFWKDDIKVVFSAVHDVDTEGMHEHIRDLVELEKKRSVKSCFYFTNKIDYKKEMLEYLKKQKFEFGSHGHKHDGKLLDVSDDEMQDRLRLSLEKLGKVNGFRSPFNMCNESLIKALKKVGFKYDGSMENSRIKGSALYPRNGCCSLFPYDFNGIVEIQSTMPPDSVMSYGHYSKEECLKVWKEKLKYIESVNGMCVMQIHPLHDKKTKAWVDVMDNYEMMLDHVQGKDYWFATPSEIADWWVRRSKGKVEVRECIVSIKKDKLVRCLV